MPPAPPNPEGLRRARPLLIAAMVEGVIIALGLIVWMCFRLPEHRTLLALLGLGVVVITPFAARLILRAVDRRIHHAPQRDGR